MDKFDQKKLIEVVLYILNKTNGIDFYRLFKILYMSEREHLAVWGNKIIMDDFVAMKFGPVPTELYDVVKGQTVKDSQLNSLFNENVSFSKVKKFGLEAKRAADEDYISESEKMILDKFIDKIKGRDFNDVKERSHDKAWQNARSISNYKRVLKPSEMAQVVGANQDMADYINEKVNLYKALQ